jgi:hypothetical protein
MCRYGALVIGQHYLEISESLRVVWLDNGRKAAARVAWHVRKQDGQPEVGNFWELDWNRGRVDLSHPPPGPESDSQPC